MSYELGLPNSLNSYLNSFIEKALIKIELGFEILTDVKILRVFSKVQAYNGLDRWVDTAFSEEGNASNFRAENSSILTEFKMHDFGTWSVILEASWGGRNTKCIFYSCKCNKCDSNPKCLKIQFML